jgi:O-methyltransferase
LDLDGSTGWLPSSGPPYPHTSHDPTDLFNPNVPPQAVVIASITGTFLLQRVVWIAAELGIADLLAKGPRSIEDLAAETKTHADSLFRVLRSLQTVGMFAQDENSRWCNTTVSELLRSDVPMSLRGYARYFGSPWFLELYGHILDSVKTGKSLHELRDGGNIFEVFMKSPEIGLLFDQAMSGMAPAGDFALLKTYDFQGIQTLVDVAGGQGGLLSRILQAHPGIKGTLFDQPRTIENARKLGVLAEYEKAGRAEIVGGSFFEKIPAGRDAYLYKQIFHNWSDAHVKQMLTVARTAAGAPGKKLIIFEMIVDPKPTASFAAKQTDVVMLAQFSGRERTPQEFTALLEATGFKVNRIINTGFHYSVIEGISV